MDKVNGKLTLWGTFQAPHAVRTVASLITNIAGAQYPRRLARYRRRLRQQGRGLSRLHLRDGGEPSSPDSSGQVDRGPDREPDRHRLRPRLPHDAARLAATRDGRITGLQMRRASPTTAPSTPAPTQPSSRPGSFRSAPAPTTSRSPIVGVDGVYTNKAPGGVAYRCSFRVTEAAYHDRAHDRHPGAQARHGPGGTQDEKLHPQGAVPLYVRIGLGI